MEDLGDVMIISSEISSESAICDSESDSELPG